MAPSRVDDDPVTAEYDVYLTPPMAEHIYLLQYPNRPRSRPYSQASSSTPSSMRIKPQSGYLELDIPLATHSNFNKYMGLRWGEATQASKHLHNSTGTFGPAAGLAMARPRPPASSSATSSRPAPPPLKDRAERDMDVESELQSFSAAERASKVFATQTLGGQIISHAGPDEVGKPFYFVGAFDGKQLHLSKVSGTAQMRPQFHHLDAEDERNRIAAARAQAEADGGGGGGGGGVARALQARFMQEDEKGSLEVRMKQMLQRAEQESWVGMEYVDEEEEEAFTAFHEKLFVRDTEGARVLRSGLSEDGYLDAVSAPGRESAGRRRRRRGVRKSGAVDAGDGEEEAVEEEEEEEAEEEEADRAE